MLDMDVVVYGGFIICILAYIYLSWNFNYWKKRRVIGPKPSIIFGNLPSVIKQNRSVVFDMQDIYEKYKKCGETFVGMFMTRNPRILVLDPKLAREILVNNFRSFRDNEAANWVNRKKDEVAMRNCFFAYYKENWKERRNDFMAGISPSKLKQAFPIATNISSKMTEFIRTEIAKSDCLIDVKSLAFKFTMEFSADFLWGIDTNAFQTDDKHNTVMTMSAMFPELSFQNIGRVHLAGILPGLKTLLKDRFFDIKTDKFFTILQKDAIDLRLRNKSDRPDFLNYMLRLKEKKNLNHLDLTGYTLTILLDSFETAAIAFYSTLYFLGINQKAQTKLRKELMDNMDEHGGMTYRVLMNLEYLDQCFNEALRLAGPIPDLPKICTETTYFENCENKRTKIEPGMIVHVLPFAFHHDPDIFENPDEFIPERFDGGKAKILTQQGCFLPFGDGPRICPGQQLALLECKVGVFEIIKNFQISQRLEDHNKNYIDRQSFIVGVKDDILFEFKPINNSK